MTTLAHLSDIHLAPLPPVRPLDLIGKRITGYLNWRMKRGGDLTGASLATLLAHLRAQGPDVIAVTGDLVNLALPAEIARARAWLETLGPPDRVCVSPGNHDAYVPRSLKRALAVWGAYADGERTGPARFPYLRRVGDVGIIACSSAVATPPFFAAGRFDAAQARRLAALLARLSDQHLFRVVLIHHPPNVTNDDWRMGLWGSSGFRAVIREAGAELVLHGHTHTSSIHAIAGARGDVPVIGIAAAGAVAHGHEEPGGYNLFAITRAEAGWHCRLDQYGFAQGAGAAVTLRLQTRLY